MFILQKQTIFSALDWQRIAIREFLKVVHPEKPDRSTTVRTRADKGQVSPPKLRLGSNQLDLAKNVIVEFLTILFTTREVNMVTCE